MTIRTRGLALTVLVSLSLVGCSAASDPDETAEAAGGTLELAVAETCAEGSDPECVEVSDEHILRPTAFEQAGVEDAVVNENQEHSVVDVTFTSEGAAVLEELSGQAAEAGSDSRLLLKVGDEIVAAVVVMEALSGEHVSIALSPDDDPQELADLLRGS